MQKFPEILNAVQDYCTEHLHHHTRSIDESDTIPEEIYRDLNDLGVFAYGSLPDVEDIQDEIE